MALSLSCSELESEVFDLERTLEVISDTVFSQMRRQTQKLEGRVQFHASKKSGLKLRCCGVQSSVHFTVHKAFRYVHMCVKAHTQHTHAHTQPGQENNISPVLPVKKLKLKWLREHTQVHPGHRSKAGIKIQSPDSQTVHFPPPHTPSEPNVQSA